MKVDKNKLLSILDLVSPGLAQTEVIEQTGHYVFKDGQIVTFNDETACTHKSPIKIKGAIKATSFRNLVRKLKEETLTLEKTKSHLIIHGKQKRTRLALTRNIVLPLKNLEVPKKWFSIPEAFPEAVAYVKDCASKDAAKWKLTCVHITPEFVEATDNDQYAYYKVKIKKLKEPVLVKAVSLGHVCQLAPVEMSVTKAWVHFRNENGLVFSCRRYNGVYRDYAKYRKLKGDTLQLSEKLAEAASRAEEFSKDNTDNQITVSLTKNRITISGDGAYGDHQEYTKVKYKGKELAFMIAPSMMEKLLKQQKFECQIMPTALKVEGTNSMFITSLNTPEEVERKRAEKKEQKEKESDSDGEE